MPPFLKDGKPVLRHDPVRPAQAFLCVCSECLPLTAWDPVGQRIVHGQYLSEKMLKEHRRMGKMRQAALSLHVESAEHDRSPSSSPSLSSPDIKRSQDAPQDSQTSSRRGPGDDTPRIKSVLDEIEADFGRKKTPGNAEYHPDLVFIHPPTSSSIPIMLQPPKTETEINSGRFALDHRAPENADLLAYEVWLMEQTLAIERLGKIKTHALRQRAQALSRDFGEELDEVEYRKMRVWDRQRIEITNAPKLGSKARSSVIDCGAYVHQPSSLALIFETRQVLSRQVREHWNHHPDVLPDGCNALPCFRCFHGPLWISACWNTSSPKACSILPIPC